MVDIPADLSSHEEQSMKKLLFAGAAASVLLAAGAASADNANVPPNSPYAVMTPGVAPAPAYPGNGWVYPYPGHREERPWRHWSYRVPNYVHDTGPPPGFMFDQPSTIGGYPVGY
jgi:hypothetical protein